MIENLLNDQRSPLGAQASSEIAANGVGEGELAALDLLEEQDRRELLADGADLLDGGGGGRTLRGNVGHPPGALD